MKRLHTSVQFELVDTETGLSNQTLIGTTSFNAGSVIVDEELWEKDPQAAVSAAVAKQVTCSEEDAKEFGETVTSTLLPPHLQGSQHSKR